MIQFPLSIAECPLMNGYGEVPEDNRLRTEMQAGPPKIRAMSTVVYTDTTIALLLTPAQTEELDYFYKTTTTFGTEEWQWFHPRTRVVITARFKTQPQYSASDGDYVASFEMEIMP